MSDDPLINQVKVIHIVPDGDISVGGAAYASVRLAHEQAHLGANIHIVELNTHFSGTVDWWCDKVSYVGSDDLRGIFSKVFEVYQLCSDSKALIHFHGVWFPKYILFFLVALITNVQYIISPHGSLENGALMQKYWKKYFARKMFFNYFCSRARALITCSVKERDSVQKEFPMATVHIVPIGIDMPIHKEKLDTVTPGVPRKTILVVSRIAPGKGLLNLVQAWSLIRDSEWLIQVAGPDENGHQRKLEGEIRKLKLDKDFTFLGYVNAPHRDRLYRSADLFVLPSLSENFGIVVAEAMSYGVLVLTTNETPWSYVGLNRGCLCVGTSPKELSVGLKKLMNIDRKEKLKIGSSSRLFIEKNFSWTEIANTSLKNYMKENEFNSKIE